MSRELHRLRWLQSINLTNKSQADAKYFISSKHQSQLPQKWKSVG